MPRSVCEHDWNEVDGAGRVFCNHCGQPQRVIVDWGGQVGFAADMSKSAQDVISEAIHNPDGTIAGEIISALESAGHILTDTAKLQTAMEAAIIDGERIGLDRAIEVLDVAIRIAEATKAGVLDPKRRIILDVVAGANREILNILTKERQALGLGLIDQARPREQE